MRTTTLPPSRRAALRATTLLGLFMALPALAQRQDEDGEYSILQARYGTARHNVDVTDQLRQLARDDRDIRLGARTFGVDPDPGSDKTLRIFARSRSGQTRTFEYREGSRVDGRQFSGWSGGGWGNGGWNGGWAGGNGGGHGAGNSGGGEYEILQARYGTSRRNIDVTDRLRELAREDRSFKMGNKTFGTDPDPGQVKTLRIYARANGGGTRTFEYREGSTVDGAQFSGWGGGGWGNGGWNGGWGPGGNGNGGNGNGNGGNYGGRPRDLQILSARYGAGGRQADVTQQLQSMVSGRQLELRVSNDTLGYDPAPDMRKTLSVTYRDAEGRTRTVTAAEKQILRIR